MNWCVFCQQPVDVDAIVCGSCKEYKGLVEANKCPRCGEWKDRMELCRDCYGTSQNPKVPPSINGCETGVDVYDGPETEWSASVGTLPDTETRLYDLSRKQNRTEAENEELARLRREYRERTGYDYV